jgi:hypothetical protein
MSLEEVRVRLQVALDIIGGTTFDGDAAPVLDDARRLHDDLSHIILMLERLQAAKREGGGS